MFPVPTFIAFLYLAKYTFMALVIGVFVSVFSSFLLRRKRFYFITDGLLGVFGFWLSLIGCLIVPWPENTIVRYVGDMKVTETANHYQHPFGVAYVVAVLLPLVHEILRFRHSRRNLLTGT